MLPILEPSTDNLLGVKHTLSESEDIILNIQNELSESNEFSDENKVLLQELISKLQNLEENPPLESVNNIFNETKEKITNSELLQKSINMLQTAIQKSTPYIGTLTETLKESVTDFGSSYMNSMELAPIVTLMTGKMSKLFGFLSSTGKDLITNIFTKKEESVSNDDLETVSHTVVSDINDHVSETFENTFDESFKNIDLSGAMKIWEHQDSMLETINNKLSKYVVDKKIPFKGVNAAVEKIKETKFERIFNNLSKSVSSIGKSIASGALSGIAGFGIVRLLMNPYVLGGLALVAGGLLTWYFWDDIKEFVSDTYDTVVNFVSDTYDKAVNFVSETYDSVVKYFKDTYDSIVKSITDTFDNIVKTVKNAFSGVKKFFFGSDDDKPDPKSPEGKKKAEESNSVTGTNWGKFKTHLTESPLLHVNGTVTDTNNNNSNSNNTNTNTKISDNLVEHTKSFVQQLMPTNSPLTQSATFNNFDSFKRNSAQSVSQNKFESLLNNENNSILTKEMTRIHEEATKNMNSSNNPNIPVIAPSSITAPQTTINNVQNNNTSTMYTRTTLTVDPGLMGAMGASFR